jgi:tetratricopeptide (TPR) repeat protein
MNPQILASLPDCYPRPYPLGIGDKQVLLENLSPDLLPDGCLRSYGKAKAKQGDYLEAIVSLSHLIDRHPDNAIDYNNRGLIYFQSGQLLKAIADYDKALQLNPGLASAYNNRANYYAASGSLNMAISDYDRALDLNPSHVRAWINRGITWRDLGQYQAAIEDLEIAALFGQLQGNIYAEQGRTYHLWGDWNLAIADYRRALAQLPLDQNATGDIVDRRLRSQVENWLQQLLSP